MYGLYYDSIKNKYGNNSRLLFTGTQILICENKTENVCEDFGCDKTFFDFSNCSTNSKQHDNSDKLVIGKTKDETKGRCNSRICWIEAKNSFFIKDNSEHKKEQKRE